MEKNQNNQNSDNQQKQDKVQTITADSNEERKTEQAANNIINNFLSRSRRKYTKKLLFGILLVLVPILLIILSLCLSLHNQKEKKDNLDSRQNPIDYEPAIVWTKCVNYDLNIEFDCPSDWSLPKTENYNGIFMYKATYADTFNIILKYYYGTDGKSQNTLMFSQYIEDLKTDYQLEEVKLSEQQAFQYTDNKNNKIITFHHPLSDSKEKSVLELSFNTKSDNYSEELLERVTNTFSLVDLMEISRWLDYKNPDLSIAFKYRPDLEIKQGSSYNSILITSKYSSYDILNYDFLFHTYIGIAKINNSELKEYALGFCGDETDDPMWSTTRKQCLEGLQKSYTTYSNNKIKGVKFFCNPYENTSMVILFPNEDKTLHYSLSSSTETGGSGPTDLGLKTIDQILSTLEFIE